MNILLRVNLVLVTLLSMTAGIPKVARLPEEVGFFESAGLGGSAVVVFGLVQLTGGALLTLKNTRIWGASAAAVTFLGSAVMLLLTGKIAFGFASVVPVLLAGVVMRESARKEPQASG